MIQITLSRRFLVALATCAVFALGCAARPFIVPPANAEQAGQKWEYMCFLSEDGTSGVQENLNQAGQQGFELVTDTGKYRCMKRPL